MKANLHEIVGTARNTKPKRVGRGSSAGGGKTAGRGTKGQKARTGGQVPTYFEGGQTPLIRRLAKRKGFRPHNRTVIMPINLNDLNRWATDSTLDTEQLIKDGRIKPSVKVKVLGDGALDKAYTISAHLVSDSARKKIEAAGGQIKLIA